MPLKKRILALQRGLTARDAVEKANFGYSILKDAFKAGVAGFADWQYDSGF